MSSPGLGALLSNGLEQGALSYLARWIARWTLAPWRSFQ
jgi:hypothetical protein